MTAWAEFLRSGGPGRATLSDPAVALGPWSFSVSVRNFAGAATVDISFQRLTSGTLYLYLSQSSVELLPDVVRSGGLAVYSQSYPIIGGQSRSLAITGLSGQQTYTLTALVDGPDGRVRTQRVPVAPTTLSDAQVPDTVDPVVTDPADGVLAPFDLAVAPGAESAGMQQDHLVVPRTLYVQPAINSVSIFPPRYRVLVDDIGIPAAVGSPALVQGQRMDPADVVARPAVGRPSVTAGPPPEGSISVISNNTVISDDTSIEG